MTDSFQRLAEALRHRLAVIGDRAAAEHDPEAHLRELQLASEAIVERQAGLPLPLDPELAHYLQRCSYDKALAWLDAH